MSPDPQLVCAFAPTGVLRASINLGNAVLAGRRDAAAPPHGVSVDLAVELANRLGVALELVGVTTAALAVEAVSNGQTDVGFFAIDPLRSLDIVFSAPYLLIEGCYMVRAQSPIHGNDEVDSPGNRVVVGQGTAYDLFLTRELRRATLVRAPNSFAVVPTFLQHGFEVAAGVKQQLEADATPLTRILDTHFMVIQQAMGLHRQRGAAAARYLAGFVEDVKASGFVADALARHGIAGVRVAGAC